ncbi:hypothetical protein [Saccharicrinis aurantiacus]|uniref:hypothetical protein n=1 Tax=Saccharicrinis aurantiacus TaxID=1849719 RepID=UPI000837E718|nr:hypothetical protein [Saccharicrinis aurantiacus]
MTKEQVRKKLLKVLAENTAYTEEKLAKFIDYSDDTELNLSDIYLSSHFNVLSQEICIEFTTLNQKDLEITMFTKNKTVEKLINYITKKLA